MKLTKEFLKEKNACSNGTTWWLKSRCRTVESTLEKLDAEKEWDWACWLMVRVLNRDDLTRMTVFSAKLVLHTYEEKYPDDLRPRSAIEAAERYLSTKSLEDLKKCRAAANAAYTAANAAYTAYAANAANAAANAANAAYNAYAAAYTDADAAAAAAAAAYTANAAADAVDAYTNAAREKIRTQIIQYVISLVKKYSNYSHAATPPQPLAEKKG